MTLRRRIASGVAALAGAGARFEEAIAQIAVAESMTAKEVLTTLRSTRFVLFNAASRTPPIAGEDAPADVVLIPVVPTPEGERERDVLLRALGVRLSCLPAIIVYVPAHDVDDGEGGRLRTDGSWREYRLGDLPRNEQRWKAEPPASTEREPAVEKWAQRAMPPSFVDDEKPVRDERPADDNDVGTVR